MLIPTHEAAGRLNTHTLNFLLAIPNGVPIDQCWPNVDEGWVDTVRELSVCRPAYPSACGGAAERPSVAPMPSTEKLPVSKSAAAVLDKLESKHHWGRNTVSGDTIRNHYCKRVTDLEEAIRDLLEADLLQAEDRKRGPFRLNPAKTAEIQRIVKTHRETSRG